MDTKKLQELRHQIDLVDKSILESLNQRFQLVQQVAKLKKTSNVPALDETRWQQVIASKVEIGKSYGFSPELIISIYEAIHKEALIKENKIINNN